MITTTTGHVVRGVHGARQTAAIARLQGAGRAVATAFSSGFVVSNSLHLCRFSAWSQPDS